MSTDPAVKAVIFQWQDGLRRIGEVQDEGLRRSCESVALAAEAEIRRRVGPSYFTADLARVYNNASDWFVPIAMREAPRFPDAWDPSVSLDAAFARMRRLARDARGQSV